VVTINRQWWEQLAPKRAHSRLKEIEGLLNQWFRTEYGETWLKVARQETGVFRIRPGQIIPVLRFIALGDRPIFIAPPKKLQDEHRVVGGLVAFTSGRELASDELPMQPAILLDVVEDEGLLAGAARGDLSPHLGCAKPTLVFSAPAHLLLASTAFPAKAYVLYQHIFGNGSNYPDDGFFYVGVTTRSWQKRWMEHRHAIESGSPLLFHRKFREEASAGRVSYVHHKVMNITDNLEALYEAEEYLVKGHWHDARRLNMIPGGKSGLKYLRENGLLAARTVLEPDERDRAVETWLRENPRKGLPAPWVSEKWKDSDWAAAQICGRENRLSVDQVRAIRELAQSHSADVIAERIGARNPEQVQRVIDDKTYTRVV
jgi:hypothetical protein